MGVNEEFGKEAGSGRNFRANCPKETQWPRPRPKGGLITEASPDNLGNLYEVGEDPVTRRRIYSPHPAAPENK